MFRTSSEKTAKSLKINTEERRAEKAKSLVFWVPVVFWSNRPWQSSRITATFFFLPLSSISIIIGLLHTWMPGVILGSPPAHLKLSSVTQFIQLGLFLLCKYFRNCVSMKLFPVRCRPLIDITTRGRSLISSFPRICLRASSLTSTWFCSSLSDPPIVSKIVLTWNNRFHSKTTQAVW